MRDHVSKYYRVRERELESRVAVVKARPHEILGETKMAQINIFITTKRLLLLDPRSGAVCSGVVTETWEVFV